MGTIITALVGLGLAVVTTVGLVTTQADNPSTPSDTTQGVTYDTGQ